MTTINIGTTKKNIVGHQIDKKFDEITYADIWQIVKAKFGEDVRVHGWCPTPKKKSQTK